MNELPVAAGVDVAGKVFEYGGKLSQEVGREEWDGAVRKGLFVCADGGSWERPSISAGSDGGECFGSGGGEW